MLTGIYLQPTEGQLSYKLKCLWPQGMSGPAAAEASGAAGPRRQLHARLVAPGHHRHSNT